MTLEVLHLVNGANDARLAGDVEGGLAGRTLELRFGCSRRLATYGTLAPGGSNHAQLADCPGVWSPGTTTGHRARRAFPVFTFDPNGPPVPVQVLHSERLPAAWPRLDAFEGSAYRRVLVPVQIGDQHLVVNVYAAVVPVQPELRSADRRRS